MTRHSIAACWFLTFMFGLGAVPGAATSVASGQGQPKEVAGIRPLVVLERRPLFTPQEHKTLRGQEYVRSLVYSASGKQLVAWTGKTVVCWDWAKRRAVFEAKRTMGHKELVAPKAMLFAFHPASGPRLSLNLPPYEARRMSSGRKATSPRSGAATEGPVRTLSPDGRWLAQGFFVGTKDPAEIKLVDTKTGRIRHRVTPRVAPSPKRSSYDSVWTSAFSNDSKYFAAATGGGVLTVWDTSKGEEAAVFRFEECHTDRANGGDALTWIGLHDSIIVPAHTATGFVRCDMKTKKVIPLGKPKVKGIGMSSSQHNLIMFAFSPDASRLVFRGLLPGAPSDQKLPLFVHDLTNGRVIGRIPSNSVTALTISPDGQHLSVGTLQGRIVIYRMEDVEILAKHQTPVQFERVTP